MGISLKIEVANIFTHSTGVSLVAQMIKNVPAMQEGFPDSSVGKESTCNPGDPSLIPGRSGRSPGGGHGYSLQYSCLESSMDAGAWLATARVHRVTMRRI